MLPAPHSLRFSLADVLPSSLAAVSGGVGALSLPAVSKAVVILVDGLGASALRARSAHARTLTASMTKSSVVGAGYPTTTAAALATLTTGTHPGEHGLVGYTALVPHADRVVNQLSGWDSPMQPESWQRMPTQFERAQQLGVSAHVVGQPRYAATPFTRAVLRGAAFVGGKSISDRFVQARRVLDSESRAIVYVYVPELDQVAHKDGWESDGWIYRLEELDASVKSFVSSLRRDEGALLTADHGVVDVPATGHVLIDTIPGLLDGVRHVAGEPRSLQLHLEPSLSVAERAAVLGRWSESESARSWVATRDEAIDAGWFGPSVHPDVRPRIGDIIVAARKKIAYYDSRTASPSALALVGQHGSISPEETTVPLLRFGAFAAG